MSGMVGGWYDATTEFDPAPSTPAQSWGAQTAEKWHLWAPATADTFDPGAALRELMVNPQARQAFGDNFSAADREVSHGRTVASEAVTLEDAYDVQIARTKALTGQTLENPLRGGYAREVRANWTEEERIKAAEATGGMITTEQTTKIFDQKLAEIRRNNPDARRELPALAEASKEVTAGVKADGARAAAENLPYAARLVANLAGGMYGMRRDPLFYATLPLGAGAGIVGKTVASRIVGEALTQSAIAAGTTALEQPTVQAWRRRIGEEAGVMPALEEVGFAALAGGIFGAGTRGLGELGGAMADAAFRAKVQRVMTGQATTAEAAAVAAKLPPALRAKVQAGLDQAHANDAADAVIARPEDVPQASHDEVLQQTIRAAENPDLGGPEIPITVRPATKAAEILADQAPDPSVGAVERIGGKPVSFERFNARSLGTDAEAFQYKGGGDAAGVSDRLKGVGKWDPIASSKVIVFERADGTRIIADGHQRLGLARRLISAGKETDIALDGFLFKAADGWTPADVRAYAAAKNIKEGSGTSLDIARVLRDRPTMIDDSWPVTDQKLKQGIGLAALSDQAWGMALNGQIPENYAAAVGSMVINKSTHAAILDDLIRTAPPTEREARFTIGTSMRLGFKTETQIDLFGEAKLTRSLLPERSRVMGEAMKKLQQDARVFGVLAQRSDIIEAAGNQLAHATNAERAASAAVIGDLITKLAQRVGPVSDLLNAISRRVAAGELKSAAAGAEFIESIAAVLDQHGVAGLLATPKLAAEVSVEAGTAEALAAAGGPTPGEGPTKPEAVTEGAAAAPAGAAAAPADPEFAAHVKQTMAAPDMVDLLDRMSKLTPTDQLPGYGKPEFQAARVFDFEGEAVTGYDAAVERLYEGARAFAKGPVAADRHATLVLGPPAAGKSTLAEQIAEATRSAIVDSDEAKKVLPGYDGGLGANAVHEESSLIGDRVLAHALKTGDNVVLPLVGSKIDSIQKRIDLLKAAGYTVDLVNMRIDKYEAFKRMIGRYHSSGRLIAPDYVVSVGDKPSETYSRLATSSDIDGRTDINGHAPRGDRRNIIAGDGFVFEKLKSAGSSVGPRPVPPGRGELRAGAAPGERAGLAAAAAPLDQAPAGAAAEVAAPPGDFAEPGLWDRIPIAELENGADMKAMTLDDAMAVGDLFESHADMVDACKG